MQTLSAVTKVLRKILSIAIALSGVAIAYSADLPQGATLLDPKLLWDLDPDTTHITDHQDPDFAISPDDKVIAYISNGAIWKCNVTGGPLAKLVELPNTKTAILAMPELQSFWNDVLKARNSTTNYRYQGRFPPIPVRVHSLHWTPNQDGVFYTLGKRSDSKPYMATYQVMHVFNERAVAPISKFNRDMYDEPRGFNSFCITRDMRHVVASNEYTPMIYVASIGKPRATPFDYLEPSSTSGRFLGVEIDTRQLVMTDEDFNITKRFDVMFNSRRRVDLLWSPDERYAVCREYLDHPSSNWVGFRIDLATGKKRDLGETHKLEFCQFTGNGGELIRIGAFPTVFGDTYISIVPAGDKAQYDVVRWLNVQQLDSPQRSGRYPDVIASRDGRLFAMAFLRDGNAPGYCYFLVDRDGNKWPCAPDDPTLRVSPYRIVAIANAGKTIVACNDTQLFSIPIESIQNAKTAAVK